MRIDDVLSRFEKDRCEEITRAKTMARELVDESFPKMFDLEDMPYLFPVYGFANPEFSDRGDWMFRRHDMILGASPATVSVPGFRLHRSRGVIIFAKPVDFEPVALKVKKLVRKPSGPYKGTVSTIIAEATPKGDSELVKVLGRRALEVVDLIEQFDELGPSGVAGELVPERYVLLEGIGSLYNRVK